MTLENPRKLPIIARINKPLFIVHISIVKLLMI